jgi:hypothetical protein
MKPLSPLARQVWCDPGFQCELTERLDEFETQIAPNFSQLFANQVWIDTLGNDSTGEINNPERPFLTANAAVAAMAAALEDEVTFNFGVGTFTMAITPGLGSINIFGAGAAATNITLTPGDDIVLYSNYSATINMVAAANAVTARWVHFGTFTGTDGTVSQTLFRCYVNSMTGALSLVATDSQIDTLTVTTGSTLTLVDVRGGTWSWTSTPALTMSMLNCLFSTSFTVVATAAGLTGNLAVLNGFVTPAATFTLNAAADVNILNPGITTTFVITTASSEVITFGGATKVATGAGTHTNTGSHTAVYA